MENISPITELKTNFKNKVKKKQPKQKKHQKVPSQGMGAGRDVCYLLLQRGRGHPWVQCMHREVAVGGH